MAQQHLDYKDVFVRIQSQWMQKVDDNEGEHPYKMYDAKSYSAIERFYLQEIYPYTRAIDRVLNDFLWEYDENGNVPYIENDFQISQLKMIASYLHRSLSVLSGSYSHVFESSEQYVKFLSFFETLQQAMGFLINQNSMSNTVGRINFLKYFFTVPEWNPYRTEEMQHTIPFNDSKNTSLAWCIGSSCRELENLFIAKIEAIRAQEEQSKLNNTNTVTA